jgi:hypothetical protein
MPKLLTKKQQKLQKELIARVRDQVGQTPDPIQTNLPGMDPATQAAISEGLQFGEGELGQARMDTLLQLLEGESVNYTPRTQEELRTQLGAQFLDPALYSFENDVVPEVENMFSGTGSFRGGEISRAIADRAAGVGIAGYQQLAGLVETELGREFQAGQNAAQRTLMGRQFALPAAMEEEKSPIRFGMLAGDTRRGIDMELANFELQKELRDTEFANSALGLAPLLLQPTKGIAAGGGSGGSGLGTALGGIAGLALGGAGGGILGGALGGLF